MFINEQTLSNNMGKDAGDGLVTVGGKQTCLDTGGGGHWL